jgi:uncharacterized protein GlcG (DUF336 family)
MITLDDARRVISAAEKKAQEIGQAMNIEVVDAGGNLVTISEWTARGSAVSIFRSTRHSPRAPSMWNRPERSAGSAVFFEIHVSNQRRVMIFAGGIPLSRGGSIIGAIGVSGGSSVQDDAVARAGASAIAG